MEPQPPSRCFSSSVSTPLDGFGLEIINFFGKVINRRDDLPSADGRCFHPECVWRGKNRDFSWKQLAVGRWGTNSPPQPPLHLIIDIINPGWALFWHISGFFSSACHAKTSPVLVAVAKLAGIVSPSQDDL